MLNHKSIHPNLTIKYVSTFSIINTPKTLINKENHKIKNYSNHSSKYNKITHFMELKIYHNYKNHMKNTKHSIQ